MRFKAYISGKFSGSSFSSMPMDLTFIFFNHNLIQSIFTFLFGDASSTSEFSLLIHIWELHLIREPALLRLLWKWGSKKLPPILCPINSTGFTRGLC